MKKKRLGFVWKVCVALSLILAIFTSGYFFLDKKIVPKYFGRYGIHSIPDLMGIVTSLYNSPKESEIISNGYTQNDFSNAINKLQKAGYQIKNDGSMEENLFEEFKGSGKCQLTDKELASVCDSFLKSGILIDALPELNYLNTINISILELTITPDEDSLNENWYDVANVSSIMKIDTEDICEQIAKYMDTPKFLLNMIIPNVLYFTINYDIDLSNNEVVSKNGSIAINGRTERQSEILINLLVDFIFPDEEKMNVEKFTNELGDIVVEGIDILGKFKFAGNFGTSNKQNGVVVNYLTTEEVT